jgi:hypothetical protein
VDGVELDVDSFRALARSGPWRWTSVHLRHREHWLGEVEAWIRRPDWTLVRRAGEPDQVVRGGGRTALTLRASTDGAAPAAERTTMPWAAR